MLASSTKSYSNLSNIVGGNDRGNYFTKLFITPNPGHALNDVATDLDKHQSAVDFMRAGGYTTKIPEQFDRDVIHEFTDYIVQIALFHREIDEVTNMGELTDNIGRINVQTAQNSTDNMWDDGDRPGAFGRIAGDNNVFGVDSGARLGNSFMGTTCANDRANIQMIRAPTLGAAGLHANGQAFLIAPGPGTWSTGANPGMGNFGSGNGAAAQFGNNLVSDRLLMTTGQFRGMNNVQRLLAIILGLSYTTPVVGSNEIGYAIRGHVGRLAHTNVNAAGANFANLQAAMDSVRKTGVAQVLNATLVDIMATYNATIQLTANDADRDNTIDAIFPINGAAGLGFRLLDGLTVGQAPPAAPTIVGELLQKILNRVEASQHVAFIAELKVQINTDMGVFAKGYAGTCGNKILLKEPSDILKELERDDTTNTGIPPAFGVVKGAPAAAATHFGANPAGTAPNTQNLYDEFSKQIIDVLIKTMATIFNKYTGSKYTTRATTRLAPVAPGAPPAAPVQVKSKALDVLWDTIYDKWNTLTVVEKQVVNSVFMFTKFNPVTVKWDIIQNNDMGTKIPQGREGEYRINLKKTNPTDKCPAFVSLLPKLNTNSFSTKVWYTNKTNKKPQYIDIANTQPPGAAVNNPVASGVLTSTTEEIKQNVFRLIYCAVFRSSQDVANLLPNLTLTNLENAWNEKEISKPFSINVPKFIRRRLYNAKTSKNAVQKTPTTVVSMMSKDIWSRNPNGNLVRTDSVTGVVEEFGKGLASDKVLETANQCYTTGVKYTNETECNKYMNECLLNGNPTDVSECLDFWKNHNFYDVAKEEIIKMHPLVALKTLSKFGFKEVHVMENGKQIKKVQSKDEWLTNTLSSYSTSVASTVPANENLQNIINTNNKLLDYLQMLTEYVNANPAIMNKNYTSSSQPQAPPQQWDKQTILGKKLFKTPAYIPNATALNGLNSLTQGITKGINRGKPSQSFTPFGTFTQNFNMPGPTFTPFGVQNGGDNSDDIKRIGLVTKHIQKLIENTLAELELKGIKVADKQKVMNIIKQLNELEKSLLEIFEYLHVVSVSKNLLEPTYTPQINTLEEVKLLAEQYENQNKKHKDLTQVLKDALQALTQNGSNNNNTITDTKTNVVSGMYELDSNIFN